MLCFNAVRGVSNYLVCGWHPKVWPFKWKLLSSTFLWYCLLCCSTWFNYWVCGWNPKVWWHKWKLLSSTFLWVREIEGKISYKFLPWEARIGSKYREFRKIRGKITVFDWCKSKGNVPWFEKSGGSKNRGFEKSGFHCINAQNVTCQIRPLKLFISCTIFHVT